MCAHPRSITAVSPEGDKTLAVSGVALEVIDLSLVRVAEIATDSALVRQRNQYSLGIDDRAFEPTSTLVKWLFSLPLGSTLLHA
jgi:hypothetical protein